MNGTDHPTRFFAKGTDVARIGVGLLTGTLPREDWTHEGHLAACLWLITSRPDMALEAELPAIIRQYNIAVGGANDDHQGYHETLTQLHVAGVRAHVAEHSGRGLLVSVNALLAGPRGARNWPLHFYSPDRLFSVEARRRFIAPDLMGFSDAPAGCGCYPQTEPQ
jgi:hypothetical protein